MLLFRKWSTNIFFSENFHEIVFFFLIIRNDETWATSTTTSPSHAYEHLLARVYRLIADLICCCSKRSEFKHTKHLLWAPWRCSFSKSLHCLNLKIPRNLLWPSNLHVALDLKLFFKATQREFSFKISFKKGGLESVKILFRLQFSACACIAFQLFCVWWHQKKQKVGNISSLLLKSIRSATQKENDERGWVEYLIRWRSKLIFIENFFNRIKINDWEDLKTNKFEVKKPLLVKQTDTTFFFEINTINQCK